MISKEWQFVIACADGTKLKPFIVFKGKRIPKEVANRKDVVTVIRMSGNAWMNEAEDLLLHECITIYWSFNLQHQITARSGHG